MTIKIEKNVPVPAWPTTAPKYPFDQMEVDDSFEVPIEFMTTARQARYLEQLKSPEKKFISRSLGQTCRFWRTK